MPRKKANPDRSFSIKEADSKTAAKKGEVVYQFKITLLEVKPEIWRRIQIPDCTLFDLHNYIQTAFGWENCHLHEFEIDGERYSQPSPYGDHFDMDCADETSVLLSSLLSNSRRRVRWKYEYDFGDCWRHEIVFEGSLTADPGEKYPLCTEGERACPLEDCGGPWGYANYLDAIRDPTHEEHEEMMEWGGPFDPEAFDAKQATKEMRRVRSTYGSKGN